MCGGLGDALKKPLYKILEQDSRIVSQVGRDLNWDWLKNEGKKVQENPGYGVGKAAATMAALYSGGLIGGASGAAAQGGAQTAAEMTPEILASMESSVAPGLLNGIPQGLGNMTMESALTDTGYTPSSLLNAFKNSAANPLESSTNSLGQNLANYGSNTANNLKQTAMNNPMGLFSSGGKAAGGSGASNLAVQMGLKMMQPPQAPPMPQAHMPQQAPMQPLPTPYGPEGNSLGMLGKGQMSEREKQRLRAMGYQV